MNRKFFIALASVLLLVSCNKDDMELLRSPYRLQGELSPSFGLPVISNGQLNLNDLLMSFDGTFEGLITDDNTITFEYKDTIRETIPIGSMIAKRGGERKSGRVERWKSGKVEKWRGGRVEEWKGGGVEVWCG